MNAFAQDENQDALIIFNKEEQTYSQVKVESNYYGIEIVTKISRRIKILSNSGLKDFATLYIPTYRDLDFKTEILNLKAQTIKSSGITKTITQDAIKETTLPANAPFLRSYKGVVKAMAFENLEVGDEIQYDYEIKYKTSSLSSALFNLRKIPISEKFKIKEASYIFHLKNGIKLNGLVVNSDSKLKQSPSNERDKITYQLNLKDIAPFSYADFAIIEDNQPYIIVDIYKTDDYDHYTSWDEYTNNMKTTGKSSIFFSGKSLKDLYAESKNEPTSTRKILKMHEIMMAEIKKSPEVIQTVCTNYSPDFEDINQILQLLNLLEINGSVLLVKSKYNGTVIKDYISLNQFNDLLVEFEEKGKVHHFNIFDPYASLDEIHAAYQGTEALKFSMIDKKKQVSFKKIPVLNSSKNIETKEYTIHLNNTKGVLKLKSNLHVTKENQFFIEDRQEYLLEKADKNISLFSDLIKSETENSYSNCLIDTFVLSGKDDRIDYQVNYQYEVLSRQPENMIWVKLSDLFYSDFLCSEYDKERTTKAVFPFAHEIVRTFDVKTDENYKVLPNLLLKRSFENAFAQLTTDYKILNPETIQITLRYKIGKNELEPTEWALFLNFIDAAHDALAQRIVFKK